MNIQVKSAGGIHVIPLEARLLAERKIFLEGEILQETACDFVRKVLYLAGENKKKSIDVLIDSPGGSISAGMTIYDTIQSCPVPIRLFCIGQAYSMGAILLACGNHGRYVLPHAELMIHEPLLGNRVSGNSSSIASISESLLDTKRKMNQILARHTGHTEEEIEQATRFDHYFSPEEGRDFGLCDEIVGIDAIMTEG